jgi:hypothetical protein
MHRRWISGGHVVADSGATALWFVTTFCWQWTSCAGRERTQRASVECIAQCAVGFFLRRILHFFPNDLLTRIDVEKSSCHHLSQCEMDGANSVRDTEVNLFKLRN